jgi:4-amino-4-deoxy-L-arabinose transferase-like glycosyltransferase
MSRDGNRKEAKNDSWFGWIATAIIGLYLLLILPGLGVLPFWHDEAHTAIVAKTILHTGLPSTTYGVNEAAVAFYETGSSGLQSGHGWLSFYLCAAGFLVGGESELAGRIPFALLGALTVLLVILLGRFWYGKIAGLTAGLLLAVNPVFIQYCRQTRYYAVAMFVMMLCLGAYALVREKKIHWGWLCALSPVLYHSFPIVCGAFYGSIFLIELGEWISAKKTGKEIAILPWKFILPVCALLLLPWLYFFDVAQTVLGGSASSGVEGPGFLSVLFDGLWGGYLLFPLLMIPGLIPVSREKKSYLPVGIGLVSLALLALLPYSLYVPGGGYHVRYFFFLLPLSALICGRGLALLTMPGVRKGAAIGSLILTLLLIVTTVGKAREKGGFLGIPQLAGYVGQLVDSWRFFHNPELPDPERDTVDVIGQLAASYDTVFVPLNAYFQAVYQLGPNKKVRLIEREFDSAIESEEQGTFMVAFDTTAASTAIQEQAKVIRERCSLLTLKNGRGFHWRNHAERPAYMLDMSKTPRTFFEVRACREADAGAEVAAF